MYEAHGALGDRHSGKMLDQRGRASTSPHTVFAPAANKGLAQASKVAPVVQTSSTRRILLLESALGSDFGFKRNAPATFCCRSLMEERSACAAVARMRVSSETCNGMPSSAEQTSARSCA